MAVKRIVGASLIGIVACGFLFGEHFRQSAGILGSLSRETMAMFRDPATQWMVFLCAGIYFAIFMVLENRGKGNAKRGFNSHLAALNFFNPDTWLCGLLLIAALSYAFDYERASTSTQALMLLAGAAIGKGTRFWANRESAEREQKPETWSLKCGTLLCVLLLLLAIAALWHPEGAMQFRYRGLNRWSGPWDNPNAFGLLVGVGVVIGAGVVVAGCMSNVASSPAWKIWALRAFSFFGVVLCGIGLLKSYSRGAWLGTALGLAFMAYRMLMARGAGGKDRPTHSPVHSLNPCNPMLRSNFSTHHSFNVLRRYWRPLSVVLFSVVILAFWQFRFTEFHPVRRAFSIANQNDFSWRNRVAAWEGALAMMADRPLTGFGWNQPEKIYDQFYRPPKVAEGMAIQLNHYFTLGMSLGLPALVCFGMYAGLSLARNAERGVCNWVVGLPSSSSLDPPCSFSAATLQAICRAGAIVLLVGLWFDGVLFNLATAAPLWVLLELGSGTVHPGCHGKGAEKTASTGHTGTHGQHARPTTEFLQISHGSWISRFKFFVLPSLFAVLLVTGLFWAKARDPVYREWLSLKTPDGGRFSAAAVMPDRGGPFPVVIWCHGAGGNAEKCGEELRCFAELGLAAIGVEYDKTNQANFDAQFTVLLDEISRRPWSKKIPLNLQPENCIAWVGHSLGAQRQLSFLVRHPEHSPAVLVRLNGGWVEELAPWSANLPSSSFTQAPPPRPRQLPRGLHVWIAHGANDEVFPANDARAVAKALETAGADVTLQIFSERQHGFGKDQLLLVRNAAECCAQELKPVTRVADNVRPMRLSFWIPASVIGLVLLLRARKAFEMNRRKRESDRWLRVLARTTAILAALVSAAHLLLPLLPVNPITTKFARTWSVPPAQHADFDWLCKQPGANGHRIGYFLEHLELASIQRSQFGIEINNDDWRESVLSPWIAGANEDIAWRRDLWEWMAPRVRRETDEQQAAIEVARQLRLRVSLLKSNAVQDAVTESWRAGTCDHSQWGRLNVAALRAVGIPARLGPDGGVLMHSSGVWRQAPRTSPGSL